MLNPTLKILSSFSLLVFTAIGVEPQKQLDPNAVLSAPSTTVTSSPKVAPNPFDQFDLPNPALVAKAEGGDAASQLNLGIIYYQGDSVARDLAVAARWFRRSAEQGNPLAQGRLGFMYALGDGVTKDRTEAAKWLRKAAEQGIAPAQASLAGLYDRGDGVPKDTAEAFKWYLLAAQQGNDFCQFNVGSMYQNGEGVTKDDVEAVKWYGMAAQQGYPDAQLNLGWMYANGAGAPKNSIEAVKLYRLAAEQGVAQAQYNLGARYAEGDGVVKDSVEGLAWLNIAAMAGSESWMKDRNMLERRVGPDGTLAAQQRSKQILREIEVTKSGGAPKPPKSDGLPAGWTYADDDQKPKASGSGAIVAVQGHVLTAAHVVAGAKRVTVTTKQGVKSATILQVDEANDLAVLKITDGTFAPLPIAPSRKMRLGQIVATIGFPNIEIQGFSPKVTRGEISSLNGIGDDPRAWQISVPVQTGNSGGPLLDENGNLVGVVVSKLGLKAAKLTGDLPQNVNYAVKGAYALALLEPYLGNDAPEPNQPSTKPRFEDMVAKAQQSVVLILVY